MADLDPLDPASSSSPTRATDLIADFHARHDAWRRQGENLARLRADARAAAGREASAILTAARADIHRVVADARRALLVLTAQLQAINEQAGEGEQEDAVSDSVQQARRDLQRLLADVRPDLDEITAHVQQFAEPLPPPAPVVEPVAAVPEVPVVDEVEHEAALAAIAPLFEHEDSLPVGSAFPVPAPVLAPAPALAAREERETPRRGKAGVVTVLAVIAASVVGAGGWWFSGYVEGAEGLAPPLAAVPKAPRVTPSWADDRIPTLSASLVALPGAASALSLDIEVRREAWLESAIDSGAPTARVFRAGETVRLHGARGIAISVRDAGALVVSVNGGPRTPLGPDGQIVTRQFSASDLQIASQ
jgi:hypothetical protein